MKKLILLFVLVSTLFLIGCSSQPQTLIKSASESTNEENNENMSVQDYFSEGVINQDLELVKWAIKNGADVNKFSDKYYDEDKKEGYIEDESYFKTPLLRSITMENEELSMLLINNDADVNEYNELKENALMEAARSRMGEVCKALIDKGIDKNALNFADENCIDYAMDCMGRHYLRDKEYLKVIKLLYDNGVKISKSSKEFIADTRNSNQMYYECEVLNWLIDIGEIKKEDLNQTEKVFYNTYLGNLDYIKSLDDFKLKVKDSEDDDLLVYAARYGKTDIAKYLLQKGFRSKKTKGRHYVNALIYATICGDLDMLKAIYKYTNLSEEGLYKTIIYSIAISDDKYYDGIIYLADKMSNINKYTDSPDDSILGMAVSGGLYNTSKALIKHGANVDVGMAYGGIQEDNLELVKLIIERLDLKSESKDERENLLDMAIEGENYEISKYLIEKGAILSESSKKYLENCKNTKMKELLEI